MSDPTAPTEAPPPTYLALAIIGFLVGIVPMAAVAVYHALQVKSNWNVGGFFDRQAALKHSWKARGWGIATLIVAVAIWTPAIIIMSTGYSG